MADNFPIQPVPEPKSIQPFEIPKQPDFASIIMQGAELELQRRGQQQKERQNFSATVMAFAELIQKGRDTKARQDMAKGLMELRLAHETREKELHGPRLAAAKRRAAGLPSLTMQGTQLLANLENAEKGIDRIVTELETSPTMMGRASKLGVARAREILGQKPSLVRDIDDLSDLVTFLRTGAQRGEKEVARISGFIEPKVLNPKDINIKNLMQVKANISTLKSKLSLGSLESSEARLDSYGLGGFEQQGAPPATPTPPELNLDEIEPGDLLNLTQ